MASQALASAVSSINEMLTNLFFACFPQGFPQRVFTGPATVAVAIRPYAPSFRANWSMPGTAISLSA